MKNVEVTSIICGNFYDPEKDLTQRLCVYVDSRGYIVEVSSGPHGGRQQALVHNYLDKPYLVLPGFIDIHVHLRGLELSFKETELTGTAAAAAAGLTLVIDMPNTKPRLDNVTAIQMKLEALKSNSVVDYGVYAAIPCEAREALKLSTLPIAGFKLYPEDYYSIESIKAVLSTNKLLIIHPELPEAAKYLASNESSRANARGVWWEIAALRYLKTLLEMPQKNLRIHVTHVSSLEGIYYAKKLLGATVDTTLHHMLLDLRHECIYKVNPPLRETAIRYNLLKAVLSGWVDALASDHAPHTDSEKTRFDEMCSPGIASIGFWPLLVLCMVKRNIISFREFMELTCRGPARILGLNRNYCCIKPGCRANFVVLNLSSEGRVIDNMFSKAKITPFYMWRLCGHVVSTFIGGELVYHVDYGVIKHGVGINPFEHSS